MTELFDAASISSDSPRLACMKKHDLITGQDPDWEAIEEEEDGPWFCSKKELDGWRFTDFGHGKTEHDAIADWAIKNNVRLWNEENL